MHLFSTMRVFASIIALLLCATQIECFTPNVNANSAKKTIDTKQTSSLSFVEEARMKFSMPRPDLIVKEHRLQDMQKKGFPIASSFVPDEYNPHPLLRNRHLQTILGVFLRDEEGVAYMKKSNIFQELFPVVRAVLDALPYIIGSKDKESECDFWDKREKFNTQDGDFFHVDYKFQDPEIEGGGEAMVMIIHGLESNSNSSLCQNMARSYEENGFDVACINFRGCCGNPNDTILQYHGGWTNDLMIFLESWRERNRNQKPMYVTGFSLGANVAMKLLGDLSMDAVDKYNIRGAAVSGAPFHLQWHYRQLIDYDFNRIVYAGSVLKSMKKKLDYITERFFDGDTNTNVLDYWMCKNATLITEIEDGMIAPLYGFQDRYDYYEKTASFYVVDDIAVPTFVLNAEDDPFFNPDKFPWDKDCENGGKAPLKLVRTQHGGHLGHLFHMLGNDSTTPVSSFAPMQLGRFLAHVHNYAQ